jgi:hypothetical protein
MKFIYNNSKSLSTQGVPKTEQQESTKGRTTKYQLANAQTNKMVRPPHMRI